jgi:hypothetical protein
MTMYTEMGGLSSPSDVAGYHDLFLGILLGVLHNIVFATLNCAG